MSDDDVTPSILTIEIGAFDVTVTDHFVDLGDGFGLKLQPFTVRTVPSVIVTPIGIPNLEVLKGRIPARVQVAMPSPSLERHQKIVHDDHGRIVEIVETTGPSASRAKRIVHDDAGRISEIIETTA